QPKHFEVALGLLEILEQTLDKVFGGTGRNELAAIAQKIFDYLTAADEPVSASALRASFWPMCKPPNDFTECMAFLINSERVRQFMLTVGTKTELVYATTDVAKRFAAEVQARQTGATPPASSSATVSPTGPSTAQA